MASSKMRFARTFASVLEDLAGMMPSVASPHCARLPCRLNSRRWACVRGGIRSKAASLAAMPGRRFGATIEVWGKSAAAATVRAAITLTSGGKRGISAPYLAAF